MIFKQTQYVNSNHHSRSNNNLTIMKNVTIIIFKNVTIIIFIENRNCYLLSTHLLKYELNKEINGIFLLVFFFP